MERVLIKLEVCILITMAGAISTQLKLTRERCNHRIDCSDVREENGCGLFHEKNDTSECSSSFPVMLSEAESCS